MPETRETASAGAAARAREYQTITDPELERLFGYQHISGTQSGHMELIRNQGLRMAKLIRDHCPASRETLGHHRTAIHRQLGTHRD